MRRRFDDFFFISRLRLVLRFCLDFLACFFESSLELLELLLLLLLELELELESESDDELDESESLEDELDELELLKCDKQIQITSFSNNQL